MLTVAYDRKILDQIEGIDHKEQVRLVWEKIKHLKDSRTVEMREFRRILPFLLSLCSRVDSDAMIARCLTDGVSPSEVMSYLFSFRCELDVLAQSQIFCTGVNGDWEAIGREINEGEDPDWK